MEKTALLFILFLCSGLATGCSPNERILYKDNIACSASNRGSDDWQYYKIELGIPDDVYKGDPVLDIRISGIGEFKSDTVPLETLEGSKNIKVQEIYPTESTPQIGKWPRSASKMVFGPNLSFVVEEDRVLQILVMHRGKFRMSGTDKWYELPCSEDEIIEVFGKPDRTYEWFRE